jgi:hypothetical protein
MAYEVREIQPKPLLSLRVTDTDGRPARLRVHTGEAVVEPVEADDWSDSRFHQPVTFVVPDGEPVTGDVPPPVTVAEAHLCGLVVDTRTQQRVGHGVADVYAEYRPDEADPERLVLSVGFRCISPQPMRIGYRVTVLQPLPA